MAQPTTMTRVLFVIEENGPLSCVNYFLPNVHPSNDSEKTKEMWFVVFHLEDSLALDLTGSFAGSRKRAGCSNTMTMGARLERRYLDVVN